MRTFTAPRGFVENPRYAEDRQRALAALDLDEIDAPIVDIVASFAELPHCYTLQCCYGHFVWAPGQDPYNLDPLPGPGAGWVRYRIAYIALCLENSARGRSLLESLARIPEIDPGYVQFGSAGWFWKRWSNIYALQVEPAAHQRKDEALLERAEALHTQGVRDAFFARIRDLLQEESHEAG